MSLLPLVFPVTQKSWFWSLFFHLAHRYTVIWERGKSTLKARKGTVRCAQVKDYHGSRRVPHGALWSHPRQKPVWPRRTQGPACTFLASWSVNHCITKNGIKARVQFHLFVIFHLLTHLTRPQRFFWHVYFRNALFHTLVCQSCITWFKYALAFRLYVSTRDLYLRQKEHNHASVGFIYLNDAAPARCSPRCIQGYSVGVLAATGEEDTAPPAAGPSRWHALLCSVAVQPVSISIPLRHVDKKQ